MADAWSERAHDALMNVWRTLRNDARPVQLACAGAIVLFAHDAGLLTVEQKELWLRRFTTCPGHEDEGGRSWCAYCGELGSIR